MPSLRSARAAFALAALLLAAALPRARALPPPCAAPVERAARAGHTRTVGCDGRGAALRGPARLLFGRALDLNRADTAALESLPGIGPALARRIAAERARRPFASAAEIVRVRGIGPHTAARLEGWVAVEPPRRER